jgi:cytidylate kinase
MTVIAIDGPSGVGKSTVAKAVSRVLGFTYMDSGAMYRCVALASIDGADQDIAEIARALEIELGDRILLDGGDVTDALRTPEVSERASQVAADPGVRAVLVAKQQELLRSGDWVAEGRDIGTVVAPHAELKVFLTAEPLERARRRAAELGAPVAEVLREQARRDERDQSRIASPLVVAPEAAVLDTTGLTLDQVVARIAELADARLR